MNETHRHEESGIVFGFYHHMEGEVKIKNATVEKGVVTIPAEALQSLFAEWFRRKKALQIALMDDDTVWSKAVDNL